MSQLNRATCKQVNSGDSIVVRCKPQGGPPPSLTIVLSYCVAPKMCRKGESTEEPFAWAAREVLRVHLVGRELIYYADSAQSQPQTVAGGTPRCYAVVFLPKSADILQRKANWLLSDVLDSADFINVNQLILETGMVDLRALSRGAGTNSGNQSDLYLRFYSAFEKAKTERRAKFADDFDKRTAAEHSRQIEWQVERPQEFLDTFKGQPLDAIVEYVRDGCTMRVVLLPSPALKNNVYRYLTVRLGGILTPTFRDMPNAGGEDLVPGDQQSDSGAEPYAEEAKFVVESRLLQREVKVSLESVTGQQTFTATVLHPRGNIALVLLTEGFAKILKWSLSAVSLSGVNVDEMLAAELRAKERRLRIWANWRPETTDDAMVAPPGLESGVVAAALRPKSTNIESEASGAAKVVEVGLGDSITVKSLADNTFRRIFFSSIRPPRPDNMATLDMAARSKLLYTVPYLYEAREFLRKKLIGKKVNILVDYIQILPTTQEQRIYATVQLGEQNVSEILVSKGLARVVRYRLAEEKRSRFYDQLLSAESVAQKKAVGLFNVKQEAPNHKVTDLFADVNRARQFLPSLKRAGRMPALVEMVTSASKLRLYVAKSTCLLTLLCAGIEAPKSAPRRAQNGPNPSESDLQPAVKADPFSQEALIYTRELLMQREVEIEVESMDRGGNFIGWLFFSSGPESSTPGAAAGRSLVNFSVNLVEQGLAIVHFTAEKSAYYGALKTAETAARERQLNLWSLAEMREGRASFFKSSQSDGGLLAHNNNHTTSSNSSGLAMKKLPQGPTRAVMSHVRRHDGVRFSVQLLSSSGQLNQLATDISQHIEHSRLVPGSFVPRPGDVCLAQFSVDQAWYRAKVVRQITGGGVAAAAAAVGGGQQCREFRVLYVDFGNEEVLRDTGTKFVALPRGLGLDVIGQLALEFSLAGVQLPPDTEDHGPVWDFIELETLNQQLLVCPEYADCVSVQYLLDAESGGDEGVDSSSSRHGSTTLDLGEQLLARGLVCLDQTAVKQGLVRPDLLETYQAAQIEAKLKRLNIWQFGDFTEEP